jgi:RNA polymerase sigma-70 factor (ECF subfamily)
LSVEVAIEDVRLARAGRSDPAAAERLLVRVVPRVTAVVCAAVGRGAESEELRQAALVEILRSLDAYRGSGSLESWAGQVAFRTVMRSLKRHRRWERSLVEPPVEPAAAGDDPERRAVRAELWARLEAGLGKMPAERRATLLLRVMHEHSVEEVAGITGVSANTVKDRLRTAFRELRALFARDRTLRELMQEVSDGS